MKREADQGLLSRPLRVDEIKEDTSGEVIATLAEREAIAGMLDLIELPRLAFSYRLARDGEGGLHLEGRLCADVAQTCVVSLDPVATSLVVPVEAEFWPAVRLEILERSDEPGQTGLLDGPEAIIDGKIDLGPLIYETLATALDPYPKREGASFEWHQPAPETPESPGTGPFAPLAVLKAR
jgi:hypothetical protein